MIEVGRDATQAVFGAGKAWIGNSGDGTISQVDVATNRVTSTFRVGSTDALRSRGCAPGTVHSAPDGSYSVRQCDVPSAIAFTGGSLWATRDDEQSLLRIDPTTHRVLNTVKLGISPFLMAVGGGSIWITDYQHASLARVDVATNSLVTVLNKLAPGPSGIAYGAGSAWIANRSANVLTRVDAASNSITAVIPMGSSPLAVTADDGAVYVKNEYDETVSRVDPATNAVVANIAVGPKEGRDGVDSMALVGPYLWVTGMRLQQADTRTNTVVRSLKQDGSTLAADADGTLWTTEIGGRLVRLKPLPGPA
ncbi:MAG: hypothetical protein NVS3B24_14060 [Candidatus Dormibacteria bacterium]